jgi:hypothetical protein
VNNRAIFKRAAEVLSGGNADTFMFPPQPPSDKPPPTDPKVVAAQVKAEADAAKTAGHLQEKALDHQGKMAELQEKSAQSEADRMSEDTRAAMNLAATRVKAHYDAHMKAADHAHDAWQNDQDRQHERAEGAQDRAHQQQESAQDRAHAQSQHTDKMGVEQNKLIAPLFAPEKGDE